MIILYVYFIIAAICSIGFFIKSIIEISKEERKELTYKDYIGGIVVCIFIIGLLWPISWILWFNVKKDKRK